MLLKISFGEQQKPTVVTSTYNFVCCMNERADTWNQLNNAHKVGAFHSLQWRTAEMKGPSLNRSNNLKQVFNFVLMEPTSIHILQYVVSAWCVRFATEIFKCWYIFYMDVATTAMKLNKRTQLLCKSVNITSSNWRSLKFFVAGFQKSSK